MKRRFWMLATGVALSMAVLPGCGSGAGEVQDVPNPERVERKEWDDMTKEEKIEFINRTPMPEEAKQAQIKAIQEGRS